MLKKEYEQPKINAIVFEQNDMIRTSGEVQNDQGTGEIYGEIWGN